MPRARWLQSAALMGALAVVLITAAPVAADAYQVPAPPSPTASCDVISPVAIPCVALGKFADAVAAECRRVGVPDARCVLRSRTG